MGRGLGFSGAARVAGLVLAHVERRSEAGGGALALAEVAADVLARGTELEGHADNIAASLFGGVVATAGGAAVRIPVAVEAAVVAWVPPSSTSTRESRTKLPASVAFDDAVFNVTRTALLVAALAAGDVGALRVATEDRLHQDVRFEAAPASRAALAAALDAGAWCGWLSGSGPSIAALCEPVAGGGRRRRAAAGRPCVGAGHRSRRGGPAPGLAGHGAGGWTQPARARRQGLVDEADAGLEAGQLVAGRFEGVELLAQLGQRLRRRLGGRVVAAMSPRPQP